MHFTKSIIPNSQFLYLKFTIFDFKNHNMKIDDNDRGYQIATTIGSLLFGIWLARKVRREFENIVVRQVYKAVILLSIAPLAVRLLI